MRHIRFTIVMIAACLCMVACTKKEKSAAPSEKQTEATTDISEGEGDEQGAADEVGAISRIRQAWTKANIDVDSGDITPDITSFALAFCKKYPEYKPNSELKAYLIQPKEYNGEETNFSIQDEKKNGYIACIFMTEYDFNTECCFWKCNNGHSLVAFWLIETNENESDNDKQVFFYDYDPETDVMTPQPQWTEMIEKAAKPFEDYSVKLPVEGKDIEIVTYTPNEEDSYTTGSLMMKWNGNGFNL